MSVLSDIWQYIIVFLLGSIPWFEIATVIPLSILAGLNPALVGLLAFLGNLLTVYLLVMFYDKVRLWRNAKNGRSKPNSKRRERGTAVWNKYGLPGLSLLGPLIIGSHIAIFIGILLGAKKHIALLWMTFSLAVWSILFTILSVYGVDWFQSLRG